MGERNYFEVRTIPGPNGVDEECVSFNIYDPDDPLVLKDVMVVGREYTFSCWAMGEADYKITINYGFDTEYHRVVFDDDLQSYIHIDGDIITEQIDGAEFVENSCTNDGRGVYKVLDTNGEETLFCRVSAGDRDVNVESWLYITHTFIAESTDLQIGFPTNDPFYIYHPQLELGNKASDWSPAPEDVEDSIHAGDADVTNEIHTQKTEILSTISKVELSASETYVKNSEYGSFKEEVGSKFSVMPGEIKTSFNGTISELKDADNGLQSKIETFEKHIKLSEDGITISAGSNSMTLRLDNDCIVFEKAGTEFGRWDGVDFYTGNIKIEVQERAQFGNFAFIPRNDGSLSFLKVD